MKTNDLSKFEQGLSNENSVSQIRFSHRQCLVWGLDVLSSCFFDLLFNACSIDSHRKTFCCNACLPSEHRLDWHRFLWGLTTLWVVICNIYWCKPKFTSSGTSSGVSKTASIGKMWLNSRRLPFESFLDSSNLPLRRLLSKILRAGTCISEKSVNFSQHKISSTISVHLRLALMKQRALWVHAKEMTVDGDSLAAKGHGMKILLCQFSTKTSKWSRSSAYTWSVPVSGECIACFSNWMSTYCKAAQVQGMRCCIALFRFLYRRIHGSPRHQERFLPQLQPEPLQLPIQIPISRDGQWNWQDHVNPQDLMQLYWVLSIESEPMLASYALQKIWACRSLVTELIFASQPHQVTSKSREGLSRPPMCFSHLAALLVDYTWSSATPAMKAFLPTARHCVKAAIQKVSVGSCADVQNQTKIRKITQTSP